MILGGVLYLIFVVIMAAIAKGYKVSTVKVLVMSFFLTPIAGVVLVLSSDKSNIVNTKGYVCPHCGFEFTEYHEYCPLCEKDGGKYKLKEIRYKSI